jgi:hypothetical protein
MAVLNKTNKICPGFDPMRTHSVCDHRPNAHYAEMKESLVEVDMPRIINKCVYF